jgi:hypothetical protein
MRCTACNANLTDYEATRRHAETGDFLDLCGECLTVIHSEVHFPTLDRPDLLGSDDILDDNPEDYIDFSDQP